MAELATVRAEIKAWERSFRESNGRPPTVDDIKQNPAIADKYKQYKKLSKAEGPTKPTQAVEPAASPSTPPRRSRPKEPPSLLLSKSRPVQPAAPLASFNPFSPQKKQKGKEKERILVDRIHESRSNPFGKPNATPRVRKQSHSPDPFPAIQRSQSSSSASSSNFALNSLPAPASAVSRARKRLRGEPVSPSPNKDKRRRVASQTTLPFPRLNLDAPSSDDGDDDFMEANSSFVDNSPVKAPTTGKSYTQLFEESLIPLDLFGAKGNLETMKSDANEPRIKGRRVSDSTGRTKPPVRKPSASKQAISDLTSSNLEQPTQRATLKLPSRSTDKNLSNSNSEVSSNRSSAKRAFSDEDVDDEVDKQPLPRAKSPLIPPSPPPSGTNTSFNRPGKGKAKASTGRKKAKLDDGHVEDDSDDLELHGPQAKLRIVGRNDMRRQHAAAGPEEDAVTSDSDPILGYARFPGPRVSSQNHVQQAEGDVEINLPDELRRVLALQSADSKIQRSEEDRLVKGLLYGRRIAHYDPQKGGEIWDVGEDRHVNVDEGHNAYTEGEDDWEGEPVPWEVGEL
ncbi:hypothetical protein GALMADRAFT_132086 [Galerina marginata CBS 339.88]|uniref:DNA replication regulator SLD2 n=1 Tax=Galerina marginata (strain CBS 339.88) TaxID=685588 RepID=A0A067U1Z7_GALM3|nr:hypothetical protein GALMADRAFT_132086 [Galerina marginata CBS 339.88]